MTQHRSPDSERAIDSSGSELEVHDNSGLQLGNRNIQYNIVANGETGLNELLTETAFLPFLVVDRKYLEDQAQQPKRLYVARAPDWSDVVHGADAELRFIERDQTAELLAAVRTELLEPVARGTDRMLHSLVVLGAPGSGKTTLVRRAAAMLALSGACVIADFGVKTGRVTDSEAASYIRALDQLAAQGTPVLMLLDDPFFANSGWVDLLRRLGRPQHRGVAVLVASPDFLYQRFAHWLFEGQVVGRSFVVGRPSVAEREQLALLYDRDQPASLSDDEDLLVVAMEAATGESFGDIIRRIWTTLNGGVPVDPAVDVRHLPWQVVAFAVVCYFHGNDVLCPEVLLHEFLSNVLAERLPSYLSHELQDLVTSDGWRVFSVHTADRGFSDVRLIGSTHALVAREAWRRRPVRGLDVEGGVLDASVRVPESAPQLAELILAQEKNQVVSLASRFSRVWGAAVVAGTMETKSLCSLVRTLQPSRAARLTFRPVMRRCLNAEGSQSWLAAWQLFRLASGPTQLQDRKVLVENRLPWTLTFADLSAGPMESIEVAGRSENLREVIAERLTRALRGELPWTPDPLQVAWLLENRPSAEAVELLEPVYSWLDEHLVADESSARTGLVFKALMRLIEVNGLLDDDESTRLISDVLDWMSTTAQLNRSVLMALLAVASSADERYAERTELILRQLFEVLSTRAERNERSWASFLATLGRLGSLEVAGELVQRAWVVLRERPEGNEWAWNALLIALGRSRELAELAPGMVPEILAWLRQRPESNESAWAALVTLLWRLPVLAEQVDKVVPEVLAWLRERPERNESVWSALISLLGRVPESEDLMASIASEVIAWLWDHPEGNESTWAAMISSLGRVPELATTVVPEALAWLRERPESNESVWSALLSLLGKGAELAEMVPLILPAALVRLRDQPVGYESLWDALLSLLGRAPELAAEAAKVLPDVLVRLRNLSGPTTSE
ncbi:ATP-binding protein [Lentzea sp. BCCO 10_0061]|uniref:ATP-binding protein n=1 Tax=Lentzea sokolovensis TaxID=3095429 RepID=A0ABU4UP71_9PSEU|nr:ATP-binding protein [Lentzea sp. BCCO 10_0061]MDX8141231.1 ATP-binding protein [Lentzea sp. BCCO 10_0061]